MRFHFHRKRHLRVGFVRLLIFNGIADQIVQDNADTEEIPLKGTGWSTFTLKLIVVF